MHRGHDHGNGGYGGRLDPETTAGPGHNQAARPRPAAQWQTPHVDRGIAASSPQPGEPDLDLVEAAFVEAFATASDPTSFLRLARIPFEARADDGAKLVLLRIETDAVTDVGSVMPHLGGASFRYDPLPAALVARRLRLRFVYFDGERARVLSLAQVRDLPEAGT